MEYSKLRDFNFPHYAVLHTGYKLQINPLPTSPLIKGEELVPSPFEGEA